MAQSRANLLDTEMARMQFAAVDSDIADLLLQTVQDDLRAQVDQLIKAYSDGDVVQAGRARHSLRGLCGSFGAVRLDELASSGLDDEAAKAALEECLFATLSALSELVQNARQ